MTKTEFVAAAVRAKPDGKCTACDGTGVWAKCRLYELDGSAWRPAPGTPHGTCYRCNGKGRVTAEDRARTAAYVWHRGPVV
jgi:hypothetical protein